MKVAETKLAGVKIVEPDVFRDKRGFFTESYNAQKLKAHGIDHTFVQDNHSLSTEAGVLRGLHYQLYPKAQTKLVRVLAGAIYDVVVDLRRSSPTYGEWFGTVLSESNQRQLLVPQGFAHGFCTLTDNAQVFYKVDSYYAPECERGIIWNDPTLAIDWPTGDPILSDRDARFPLFQDAEANF
ncbi:dTDP-4-dehydrorhamnose 3,5-epimerase [Numidum massiliense]|uniref:dTDP-4-dehydrorhamnose 3,5-epimerase n=1 Tax=Numidum massiliense TaxID=1522315 RepID=UPI0006D57537|nr:dTDP-4-dehydrorhamnose 3,5-epimerase [Numidum massiliense]